MLLIDAIDAMVGDSLVSGAAPAARRMGVA